MAQAIVQPPEIRHSTKESLTGALWHWAGGHPPMTLSRHQRICHRLLTCWQRHRLSQHQHKQSTARLAKGCPTRIL